MPNFPMQTMAITTGTASAAVSLMHVLHGIRATIRMHLEGCPALATVGPSTYSQSRRSGGMMAILPAVLSWSLLLPAATTAARAEADQDIRRILVLFEENSMLPANKYGRA